MIERLKPLYHAVLRPVILLFRAIGVKPNHLTIAGVVVFGVAGWYCAIGNWIVAAILVTLGAFMDGWDGLLARETGQITRFGAILDSTCDRITEILWLAGILAYYVANPSGHSNWSILFCFAGITGSLMVSYVKARCEGGGITCAEGLFQRPERIVFIGLCLFAGPKIMTWGLLGLAVLTWVTVIQRLVIAYRRSGKN